MSAVLLYDEDCGFCRWSTAKILRWGRRRGLRAIPIQSDEGQEHLSTLKPEKHLDSWHLVTDDGLYSAGAAVAPLTRIVPFGAPIALMADTFPRTTERAYRWVARNREKLGRWLGEQACAVRPGGR